MINQSIANISTVLYCADGAYLNGFPALDTVEGIMDSVEQFYEQKQKPTTNTFKLFPRQALKSSKLIGSLLENLQNISAQFQFEEEAETTVTARNKKQTKPTVNAESNEGLLVKRTPLYRLYSPTNPVLREQYTVLMMDEYRRVTNREEEEAVKERAREWIQMGYHTHVAQAFKIEGSQGKMMVFCEKLKGANLRDWIHEGFFSDKNKHLNSKRVLNCILQVAVGLNYIHARGIIVQQLIPDFIYVENERVLKIGNICSANLVLGRLSKHACSGGSPEYWSPEQGNIFDSVKERAKEGAYQQAMKLLPALTAKSDVYQLGLLIVELLYSKRQWSRGDKTTPAKFKDNDSHCSKEVTNFLLEQASDLMQIRPDDRITLANFIPTLLDFYSIHFKNAEDLLWCRFFDQEKYESDLLNNKAVGLYLSGNQGQCEKAWMRSVASNPRNLTAQYNYSHFRRMKRIIDDRRLNKDLLLQPQSRKRNYYLLVSNLVMLPLLKQPFKTYNFSPKLSKQKEIEVVSNMIDTLEKFKHDKGYAYLRKYHLARILFDEAYILKQYFVGRLKNQNVFQVYNTSEDIVPYKFTEIRSKKEPSPSDGRQTNSAVDLTFSYLAFSDNSYLCIYDVKSLPESTLHFEMQDYGSAITTLQFDQKSEVLGVGSSEFIIKLINLTTKATCKVINIGQKFIIRNLAYYDRNTCIGYSYQRAITFHRIQTTKQLFTIRTSATIVKYVVLEVSLNSHLLVAHTTEKFEIWNLKDKVLIRNIEIDQAPKIQGFFANSAKKLMVHYTQNVIRIWNYSNGLILKTYRTPVALTWVHLDAEAKYLRSLDIDGNYVCRSIDFSEFIKHFEGVCIPNEICLNEQREEVSEETALYVRYGRELIDNLNEYRLNEQEKKVSLQRMYRLAQTIKGAFFYQDKQDMKTIFTYLNGVRQSEDRSSRINAHSEQYVFTSTREEFITATSNVLDNTWLIGESDGSIRLVSAPDTLHFTIKPKAQPVSYLHLTATSLFVGYQASCLLIERQTLDIVVQHTAYHKKTLRLGLVLNGVLVTGDEDELILFWHKEKVRRYQIEVNCGEVVGKKLVVAGFDNRIRVYELHPQNGIQKLHVFVGHVKNIYKLVVIDDSIFTSYSYDGTIRWWNTQGSGCFSYFNFQKYLPGDKVLGVDLPKFALEDEKIANFNREGCALVLLNASEIVVFDTMRKEVKWRLELADQVLRVFWTGYPNSFAAVTYEQVIIYSIFWRYTVLKK